MAITQFVSDCLSDYIAFTDIDTLFNTLIKNLKFFKYFYRYYIFQYIFFVIFILTLGYLIYKPWVVANPLSQKYLNRNKDEGQDKDKKNKKEKKKDKNFEKATEEGGSQEKKLMGKKKNISNINLEEKEEKLDIESDNNNKIDVNSFEDSDDMK